MKKATFALFAAAFALCANVFAVAIGDTVSYTRNSKRTSSIIRKAEGDLAVIATPSGYTCNGTVVKMDYALDVLLKGKQQGDIGVCVPNSMFGTSFYTTLATNGTQSFGAFDLEHRGFDSATDANGQMYQNCDVVRALNVDHHFQPEMGATDQAKVLWINHSGSLKSIDNLKVSFKAARGVKVLGAVEVDIAGVSDSGVSFKVGFDKE